MSETGFTIDGADYPIPSIDTFTMDEAQILYDRCGLILEDFSSIDPDGDPDEELIRVETRRAKMRNPGFVRALLEIAYRRGNPDARPGKVADVVGAVPIIDVLNALADDAPAAEADASPLDETNELGRSSPRSSDVSSIPSGIGSPSSSAERDAVPATIGTTGSDT